MKGYLQSKGIFTGEHALAASMQRVAPEGCRNDTIDRTNPIPY